MKKSSLLKKTAITLLTFLMQLHLLVAQEKYTGAWEGMFMNDFLLIIHLNFEESKGYYGNLVMYAEKNLIQDDELSAIEIDGQNFSFYLAAKETVFNGTFDEDITSLSGEFVFPDGSKHPLTVRKKTTADENANAAASLKEWKQQKYPMDQLREDLNFLTDKLQEIHPALYRYSTMDEVNGTWAKADLSIDHAMTLEDFYLHIAPAVEVVKCSHTGIRLPPEYISSVHETGNFFPLKMAFANNKTFSLTSNKSTMAIIEPGSEILQINNMGMDEIKEKLFALIPAEGNNQTTKYNRLNWEFNQLFYFLDDGEEFSIDYLDANNNRKNVVVNACVFNELGSTINQSYDKPVVQFFNENNIGFLKIGSFAYPDINHYIQLMDSIFLDLQKQRTNDLVLDLRDNEGGHPIFAAQLLSYLTNRPFKYFKRNPDVPDFEPFYDSLQPNPVQFEGKIYVFVNGGCLSTTGHLISLLKYYTDAEFIGEEPGSTYICNDYSIQLKLPNTGMEVNIPRTTFETDIPENEIEIPFQVDYPVKTSVDDLLKGRDGCKEIVFSLVKKGKQE